MDPFSVIVLALIYAALKAPGEAGRAVRNDYRGRRDRWTGGWNARRGRGRGVAGYDRSGRGYTRDQRSGRRRGDPGWWRDPAAWRGREGRARVARGIRPSAIRTGIITGALAYSALFGAGVAARGFARGLRGGYRLGRIHYREKLARREGGATFTVTPGSPGDLGAEVVDGVIVSDLEDAPFDTREGHGPDATPGPVITGWIEVPDEFVNDVPDGDDVVTVVHGPGSGERPAWLPAAWQITVRDADDRAVETFIVTDPAELRRRTAEIGASPYRWAQVEELARVPQTVDRTAAGWVITVFDSGQDEPFDRFTSTDPDHVDQFLREIAATGRLRAEIAPLPDPEDSRPPTAAGPATPSGGANVTDNAYEWQCPECGEPAVQDPPKRWTAANGPRPSYSHLDGEPLCPVIGAHGYEPAAPAPRDPRPSAGSNRPDTPGDNTVSDIATRPATASPAGITGHYVPVGAASISAPMLMEGANYGAHLHNLEVIAKEATAEYNSAELTLASASAARQRAEHAMTAVEQMAAGLAAQDFGERHVGNMTTLNDLLSRQVAQARTAEHAAQESLATAENLIVLCVAAAAEFKRDHGQLAEAHAAAPHAAKTREAYQPM